MTEVGQMSRIKKIGIKIRPDGADLLAGKLRSIPSQSLKRGGLAEKDKLIIWIMKTTYLRP
jgi:hypothetical protein